MDWGMVIGVSGVVLAVLGILVTYIFYKNSLKKKDLCWAIRTNNLISDYTSTLSDLRVQYRNWDIASLSVSNVMIWNAGREVIDERDLDTGEKHRLRLVTVGDVDILNMELLEANNPANGVRTEIDIDSRSAAVDFRYLGHQHGAVFQVVHTGKSSDDLDLVGEVRGVEAIAKKIATRRTFTIPGQPTPTIIWAGPLALILGATALNIVAINERLSGADGPEATLSASLAGAFTGVALWPIISLVRWWRRRLPPGLTSFTRITAGMDPSWDQNTQSD